MVDASTNKMRPNWVSNALYPFTSRYFQAPRGRIHYVDEGEGVPVVFVHGNPTWSFEYRHLITALRDDYRCIALDHLGFGLSDRSRKSADYHPAAHTENFAALLDYLNLERVTLVFADWGGPIALDFARRQPDRVAGLVVLNTWCWPVNKELHFVQFSFVMASWPMQFLIRRFNFFVKQVMPSAVGDRAIFTKDVMAHYAKAQPNRKARAASAALPRYIVKATPWLRDIWNDRAAFANKPALVLWGLKDIAFRPKELKIWQAELNNCTTHEFPACGHFLAEEAPDAVAAHIRAFVGKL